VIFGAEIGNDRERRAGGKTERLQRSRSLVFDQAIELALTEQDQHEYDGEKRETTGNDHIGNERDQHTGRHQAPGQIALGLLGRRLNLRRRLRTDGLCHARLSRFAHDEPLSSEPRPV